MALCKSICVHVKTYSQQQNAKFPSSDYQTVFTWILSTMVQISICLIWSIIIATNRCLSWKVISHRLAKQPPYCKKLLFGKLDKLKKSSKINFLKKKAMWGIYRNAL